MCVLWCVWWWCLVCWCVCGACCGVCVWRGLARGKPPCVSSKRLRLYVQNASCVPARRAHVEHMGAFSRYTRSRFERTHGGVWSLHKEGLSLLVSFLLSLFRRSFPSFSSFVLFSLLSSLSNNDNDHSSSQLSLCTHGSDLPECQSTWPVGMKWPVSVLEMSVVFGCVLVVFGCVGMCLHVTVCLCVLSSLCSWLRRYWRRCVGCCVVVTVQQNKERANHSEGSFPRGAVTQAEIFG